MTIFYNVAQPSNIRDSYGQNSQVDFLIRQVPNREIIAGSLKLVGKLSVTKTTVAAPSTSVPITITDKVFINPYAGAHVFISNATSSINDRTIESLAQYGRKVAMDSQATHTLEELTAASDSAVEMKGNNNNVILAKQFAPFAISPNICLNKTSGNLGASKYSLIKVMFTLSSALEALYISTPQPSPEVISQLSFSLSELELHWVETIESKTNMPITFNTNYLVTQTVVSSNTNLNLVAPNPYDAVSVSFIQQDHRNTKYFDSNMCEYIRDIDRIEFTVNNSAFGPLTYPIITPAYQDIALNYLKSLQGDEMKNCIVNRLMQENGTFGVGMQFASSQNDKLGIAMTINPQSTFSISTNPYDAVMYINGYLEL
jgi:hypothetical protein